jgi:hypothetical protein
MTSMNSVFCNKSCFRPPHQTQRTVQVCGRLASGKQPHALKLFTPPHASQDPKHSSAIIPFEVQAGAAAALRCSGVFNEGEAVVLGACEHKGLANSIDCPKFCLCLQVTDRCGMLCKGAAASVFLREQLPKHSFELNWKVRYFGLHVSCMTASSCGPCE